MTRNFHKQSPWKEACCSFQSHDFNSLTVGILYSFFSCSLIFHSPHSAVQPSPSCTHAQTDGNFSEIKIPFLAPVQNFSLFFPPFFFFLLPPPPKLLAQKWAIHDGISWLSTRVHTFTLGRFPLTRWEVFFLSGLMWYRYECCLRKTSAP